VKTFGLIVALAFLANTMQVQGSIIYEDTSVQTLAGTGAPGYLDGSADTAEFKFPSGVCIDKSGNLYVADTGNHRIRKISATGTVTTIAGTGMAGLKDGTANTAQFDAPHGICIDSKGNLFVSDLNNKRIRKITPTGSVSTFVQGLEFPTRLEIDTDDNLYLADWASAKKIAPTGSVTQIGGSGYCSLEGGVGALKKNFAVASPATYAKIVEIGSGGSITTYAGGNAGFADGPRLSAGFQAPTDITADGAGNLFVSDATCIRKINASGQVTTLAGSGEYGNLDGTGNIAQFKLLAGLCVDSTGNVYVCDLYNHKIFKITAASINPGADVDNDGIPDSQEGSSTPYVVGIDDRNVDTDGDGFVNANEFIAGTSPLDKKSLFTVNSATVDSSGLINITWPSAVGKFYQVQISSDLKIWTNFGALLAGTGSTMSLKDAISTAQKRFYRVTVQ
jgi:hypothetical protein